MERVCCHALRPNAERLSNLALCAILVLQSSGAWVCAYANVFVSSSSGCSAVSPSLQLGERVGAVEHWDVLLLVKSLQQM
jgi:hypothetical protein